MKSWIQIYKQPAAKISVLLADGIRIVYESKRFPKIWILIFRLKLFGFKDLLGKVVLDMEAKVLKLNLGS